MLHLVSVTMLGSAAIIWGTMRRFRLAQIIILSAFVVFVRAAVVRVSQMIDYDEPWHGPIKNYSAMVEQHPVINVVAVVMGVALLVAALALVLSAVALSMRRWRTSVIPTLVTAAALGLAGVGLGGWWLALDVLGRDVDVEWSAVVGTLAAATAVIAAAYGCKAAVMAPGPSRWWWLLMG